MSLHGTLPLTGREKISSRVRWCFRFIPPWYCNSVPVAASVSGLQYADNSLLDAFESQRLPPLPFREPFPLQATPWAGSGPQSRCSQ